LAGDQNCNQRHEDMKQGIRFAAYRGFVWRRGCGERRLQSCAAGVDEKKEGDGSSQCRPPDSKHHNARQSTLFLRGIDILVHVSRPQFARIRQKTTRPVEEFFYPQSPNCAPRSLRPALAVLTCRMRRSFTSSLSRWISSTSGIAPRSPSTRSRTDTVPALCSLSPTTSM
jgi:hypothetical protein